jgi:hypothetical protein
MSVDVLIFSLLGAVGCVLYLLYHLTAKATPQDVAATLAVMNGSAKVTIQTPATAALLAKPAKV